MNPRDGRPSITNGVGEQGMEITIQTILTKSGYIGPVTRRQSRASFIRVRQERVFIQTLHELVHDPHPHLLMQLAIGMRNRICRV
jgi:hypothetical protein